MSRPANLHIVGPPLAHTTDRVARTRFGNYGYLLGLILLLTACSMLSPLAPTPTPTPDVTVCASGCDFTTLQAALDAESTVAGDVIAVQEAVHTEAGIVVSKSVVIQGQSADATIVQADPQPETATERVFRIPNGVTVTLRALTIRHGNPRTPATRRPRPATLGRRKRANANLSLFSREFLINWRSPTVG